MMTLKELKNLVKPADPKKRVPCAVSLKQSGARIVAREAIGLDTDITVYANGYVLYQEGDRTTVFPLHTCNGYGYESVTGQEKVFRSDFFDNENWYVRLLMEATDRMERNQEKVLSNHNVFAYESYSEGWEGLKDPQVGILELLVEREMVRDLMSVLTEKQRKAVTLYYLENMKQEDICAEMGVTQQSVCEMIKRAVAAMRKHLEQTENIKK